MLLSLASLETTNTKQILQLSSVINNFLLITFHKKPNQTEPNQPTLHSVGSEIRLDVMVFDLPRQGPTIWEIGIPDRTAAEFYVPDPYPTLMNKLYNNHADKFVLILLKLFCLSQ